MSYCQFSKQFYPACELVVFIHEGKKMLVHPSQLVVCMDCHETVLKQEAHCDSRDNYLCDDCEPFWKVCDDCGEFCKHTILISDCDKEVCQSCLEDNYRRCDFCGEFVSDYETDRDDNVACRSCLRSNVRRCEGCERFVHDDDINWTSDDYRLCERCFQEYTITCDVCGDVYYYDEDFEFDDGDNICPRCQEEEQTKCIHEYRYKPVPNKKMVPGENTNEYFGFEIEVCGSQTYAKDFKTIIGDDIYLKQDGSVDGFEIVTHPMTRDYFYEEFIAKLKAGMKFLISKRFSAHNKAGIHIHVSSEAINAHMLKRMIDVVYQSNYQNREIWRKISQRTIDNLEGWASVNPGSLRDTKAKLKRTVDFHENNGWNFKPTLGKKRYTAINTENSQTVEFRIFNSNLRIDRIVKNAQVIFSLIDFSKIKTTPTLGNYLRFVFAHKDKYRELADFLLEKNIYNPNKGDYSQLVFDFNSEDDNERGIECA